MNQYIKENIIKIPILACFVILFADLSFAQGSDISLEKTKRISLYFDIPFKYTREWGQLCFLDIELQLLKESRLINPAFNVGIGATYYKGYGIEAVAVPIEFILLTGRTVNKFELGFGIVPIGADVLVKSRIGFRTLFFDHLLVRFGYTPYFPVPYGDRVEGKPYIDTENDFSFSIGYTF